MGVFIDLTGQKFGKLTVISRYHEKVKGRTAWSCICDCGKEKITNEKLLKVIKNVSCGCHFLKNKDTKICVDCKIEKNKSAYHKSCDSVQSRCIECLSKYRKIKYWGNREAELAKLTVNRNKPKNVLQRKGYYQNNKDDYRERYKKIIADPIKMAHRKEVNKIGRIKYNDKINKQKKEYSQRPEVKLRKRENHQKRKVLDMQYVLKRRLRFRLRNIINRLGDKKFKNKSAMELLGCDIKFLKKYLEDKFTEGMSWEIISEIEVDHIKPCAKFSLTDPEEQKKCFHYTNLQPLWALDNTRKGAKYDEPTTLEESSTLPH